MNTQFDVGGEDARKRNHIITNKLNIYTITYAEMWDGQLSEYSDGLRARQSGDRIPVGARFSAHPDQPWGPPRVLYNGYWVFPRG